MSLDTRLRQIRAEHGLSLSEVANEIGCTKAHLWELESGRADNPRLNLLRSAARFYGVTIAWLAGEAPERYSDSPQYREDDVTTWGM